MTNGNPLCPRHQVLRGGDLKTRIGGTEDENVSQEFDKRPIYNQHLTRL